jgi:hypothetical protein
MTAPPLPQTSLPTVHQAFRTALPQIDKTILYHFRRLPRRAREEALADARAAAWSAWYGLLRRGNDPVAVGITGIAFNACRYVKNRRRLGNVVAGRGRMDIHHRRAQQAGGFTVVSYDSSDGPGNAAQPWRSWLAADNRCSPADEAAFRIDFESWLVGLPARKRQIAELLALGHKTGVVAKILGVTPAAVSQTRPWLAERWQKFQGIGDGSK